MSTHLEHHLVGMPLRSWAGEQRTANPTGKNILITGSFWDFHEK